MMLWKNIASEYSSIRRMYSEFEYIFLDDKMLSVINNDQLQSF